MVRETRYLYVGNLPESIIEERILDLFSSYGKIQGVKILTSGSDGPSKQSAIVAFMDIKSASKAQESEIILDGKVLVTQYNESSMTVTVQTDKKETTTKQHSPGDTDGITSYATRSKSASHESPSQAHLHNFQKVTSSNVQTSKYDETLKPLGMLFQGFPTRSTDSSIRDGLYHDYKKYGKVLSINVIGQGEERHAIVSFKKAEDAAKALEASHDKKFFGAILQVFPHEGLDIKAEFRQQDEQDEYHPKASRTLFVGNLDKNTSKELLKDTLSKYGYIIDIDIKNQSQGTCYAFIQYDNIRSVVQALKDLEDEHINNSKVKVGFGKSMPTTCVWIEGISDTISEKYLALQHLSCYGCIAALYIDRNTTRALVYYDNVDQAFVAVKDLKGRIVSDKRIQVDFASRDCQNLFLDAMEQSGQLRPGDRPEDRINRGTHPFEGCEFTRQWPFDPNQPRNRFFPYEGPSVARGGYASRPYFAPGRPATSRLPFYDGFEQRRENCMGVRSSFKPSFEQLYEKDALVINRNIKERSLSLERSRSLYRGVLESSVSRDDDVRYSEEWDVVEEKESVKKLERKRSRHHHKDKSPLSISLDSKGSMKKVGQSPLFQTNYPQSVKKHGKSVKSSRSANDAFNRRSHLKNEGNVENWIDLNTYSESEKGRCKRSSPSRRKKSKNSESNTKRTSRKSKNYSDESSRSSSILSSESLISLNSESGDSASKSSDEVDLLVKKKQELIKMLEAMEEEAVDPEQEDDDFEMDMCPSNDCNDDKNGDVKVIPNEAKDQKRKSSRSCSLDSSDKSTKSKGKPGTERCSNSSTTESEAGFVKKKNFPIKTDSITSPIAVPKTKSPQDENVTYSKSKHSKKECVTDKICQKMEENETFDKKDETLIKECFSPPEQAQVESEPIALDSIKTEPEVCLANPVNVGEMEVNKQQAGDSVVSMGEFCEEKSYEPRNVDKSKKVREVMSLPLPRFAFDLPSLRKKNTTGESEKSDGPLDSKTCHNTPAATASVKSEVLVSPPNIMSEEESCTNAKTNRESSNSDSVKVEDEAKEVEENEKISKVKEESSECSEKIEPADVEATKSAGTVETYQSIKCDPLDYKQETKDDFMASVLDDLRMESGENIEDDTSLEERIRALDEKLSKIQQGNSKLPSSNLLQPDNSHPTTNTVTSLDYREKYKRHRREHPAANVPVVSEPQRLEPSDLAKILLSRSSIFDQDTQRLEMLNKITKNDNNGTSAALNFPIHSPNSFHTSLQPIAQNVTPPLFSGLKGLIPSLPLTSSFTARFNSSMSHLSSYNVSLTSFKTSEVNHKAYVDGSMRMPPLTSLHTSVSGDPRRIAKPLDILSTTTKPGLSNDVQGSQFADLCDTHGVIPGTQGSSKSNPPVSILKKQGSVHDEAPQVMEPSSNDVVLQQVHSNKRKSEVAFGSEQHSKQPGKVLITDKSETTPGKLPSVKSQNTVAGNTLIKSTNKPTTVPKSTLKSQQGQIVKNKPANVASKPSNPEKRTSKTDDGVSNATSKREYDSGSKSHTNSDLKSKENVDDDKQTSKEKNRDKLAIAKRSHEEPKEDSDKKAKPLTKSNAPIDLKDSSKKDIKKDDQKSALSSIKSLNKIPSKSKSLQEVQNKKSEDVQKDKSHGDKTQPLQKTEKVVSKPKLTQKSSDDGKELKMPSKPTVLLKEDKKSKMKMVNSLGKGTPHDSVKKSSKPNFVSSCSSKEKKPEEKREVKALLQELGSAEDNAPQYVSMYDMVKRRSNKDASVSKGKEVRTKSLSQLKSSKKRCQSRKNSLRLSSNDSDSNADCGSSMKHKSRQKRISSSSSSSSTSESPSSSGSEDDEKDVTIRKTKKKPGGYFRSAPVKRKVFPDSSSDESIDQDIVPKTKKFLAEKPKSSDSRMETVKSPAYADYPPRKLPSISESLANKEDLHYSTQSSSSASEDVMPAKESPSVEIKKNDSIPQDFDLNLCPESEKDDEQVTDKNIKKELNLASSNLQSNDESNSCISEAKTVRDDERSSIECDAKSQTEKIEDYDKMEIRDCMSDDALLDQMDDDSIVTPLPGFEGVTFELAAQNQEKQEDGGFKVGIVENTFSGVFVISKSLIDTSTKENVCQVEPSSGSTFGSDVCATNVESFSNKSQLGSEVGEPVFDDVDTDNNTEELDLAIKSLFRDGEETKYDQTLEFSEKKDDETLSSRIDIGSPAFGSSFASTSNSKEVTDAPEEDIKLNAESSQPVDVKLEKEENECTDEKSELNATDDSEVKSIATASIDNSKESSRPKEFTGHFISTFKPEQSECAEQNLASPKAVTKCKDSIESLSANDCTMEDVSKKRLCEDEYDAPNKKIKLEDGEQSTNVPDKESANNVNDSSLPIVSKSESEAGLCEAVVTSSDHQRSPSVQSHLVSSTSFSKSAMQSSEASCRLVAATIPTFQSYSSNITSASYPITCESSGFATTCQSNVERVIEEVAKGNFERGYEADYYVSQKKLKVKNKDDAITNSNVLIPSHSINSPAFSTVSMSQVSQCQSAPQGHFFSRNMQGLGSQTVPATAMPMPAQNVLIASSEVACQPQNITIMTGSGLVQVSSSNIPSIQHLQMYSAGVAAARQLASSQLQQSLAVNHDMLTQHRLLRPSVDAAPISFRPQNTSVSTAGMNLIQPQCQLQVHHQIPSNQLQQGPNSQPVHQRLPHSPDKLAPASQHRLQSVEVANSVQQNMLGQPIHSFQYQPRPGIISTQVQLPNSSNPGQTCNSFMQQQQELFNRSNMLFRGQMKMDQQPSFAAMDNLSRQISPKVLEVSQQGNVRPSLPNLASPQTPIPQMTKGNNLPSDVLEGMQNNLRPMMTKGDCRQQQLFIRPIVAMQQQQQQQPLSTSSCMEQSSVAIGQHRMPITVKEPRLVSNLTRAEPKTPGTNTIQQPPLMLSIGSVGQQVQNQSGPHDSLTQQPSINLFPGLTSPPVGILGSAVLIPPQQQQLALEKSLLLNASVHQQQQQRLVQPAAVFQYAAPSQHVNLHHLSNTSQLEFFVAGNRMVAPIIQALPTDSMINHGQAQPTQGIHLSTHMQPSMMQQQRPNPESLDRGLAVLSQKLPVVWQGLLALKNDSAHVQMHYVCGSKNLVQASLPDNVAPLRIAQRMRLEPTQLEQVTKRMNESDFSMLLAVPCGRDPVEIMTQSHNLQTFFIHYLQQKQAAGIVNILQPNSTQTAYVVHIFPPCEFSLNNLNRLPPDVVQNLGEGGYLLIIITTC